MSQAVATTLALPARASIVAQVSGSGSDVILSGMAIIEEEIARAQHEHPPVRIRRCTTACSRPSWLASLPRARIQPGVQCRPARQR